MSKVQDPKNSGKRIPTASMFPPDTDLVIGIMEGMSVLAVRDDDGCARMYLTPEDAARAAASIMVSAMALRPDDADREKLQEIFRARMVHLCSPGGLAAEHKAHASRRPS